MKYMYFAFPAMFFMAQNKYFGWNARASSDAEIICDGINILLFMLACYFVQRSGK